MLLFISAISELTERHTGVYLKEKVFQILQRLDIFPHQIYSIAIDNGSNMVKMASLMAKDTLEINENEDIDKEIIEENFNEEEQDDVVEGMLQDLESIVSHTVTVTLRCGAHTVQLVVSDACKGYQHELKMLSKVIFLSQFEV